MNLNFAFMIVLIAASAAFGGDLSGRTLLITTVRTGETEVFAVDPDSGDARNLPRSLRKVCTPAAWSPDGAWISFRMTDERYWSDPVKMKKIYSEKPAGTRPVWIIRPDGSDARVTECLRFQCAIDGSRASWKP